MYNDLFAAMHLLCSLDSVLVTVQYSIRPRASLVQCGAMGEQWGLSMGIIQWSGGKCGQWVACGCYCVVLQSAVIMNQILHKKKLANNLTCKKKKCSKGWCKFKQEGFQG